MLWGVLVAVGALGLPLPPAASSDTPAAAALPPPTVRWRRRGGQPVGPREDVAPGVPRAPARTSADEKPVLPIAPKRPAEPAPVLSPPATIQDTRAIVSSLPESGGQPPARMVRSAFRGTYRSDLRVRATGDDSDKDLYQYLQLSWGDANAPGLSASFHGRLTADLDGRGDDGEFFVFDSITDTYDKRLNARLYHAFLDLRPAGRTAIERLRLGRQFVEGGDVFHLDGLRVDTTWPAGGAARGELTVFGGIPAHLFESSLDGDVMVGGRIVVPVAQDGRASVEFVHIQDDSLYYGAEEANLLSIGLRGPLGPNASAWAQYQHLNGEPREFRVDVDAQVPTRDVFVRAAFYSLLTAQQERVTDLDPFFAVARALEPFWTASVSLSKGLSDHVHIEAGVDVRRLYEENDESRFNHAFERYFVLVGTENWPRDGFFVTLTGEHWQSADRATTFGAEVEYRPSKAFRLRLGTDFQLYRFDFYEVEERQSSRSVYVRLRWRPSDRWRAHLRLRVEDDDFDTYVRLDTGFEHDF